jgi:hypothetical protein
MGQRRHVGPVRLHVVYEQEVGTLRIAALEPLQHGAVRGVPTVLARLPGAPSPHRVHALEPLGELGKTRDPRVVREGDGFVADVGQQLRQCVELVVEAEILLGRLVRDGQ